MRERMARFAKYMKMKGLNDNTVTVECGLSQGLLSQARTGKSDLGAKAVEKILNKYQDINRVWLLTGEGEMTVTPEISYTDGVPYYDEVFECGFDELVAPSGESPEYLIRMPGYERATLWCNASGHSMEPEINNGDIIALQRVDDPSFLPFGDIYAIVTTNGLRTIKRLGRSDRDGCYRLIPTNPAYDEQEIRADQIALVYRLMGAMKAF